VLVEGASLPSFWSERGVAAAALDAAAVLVVVVVVVVDPRNDGATAAGIVVVVVDVNADVGTPIAAVFAANSSAAFLA
jgi:molybdopterin-guanine dinucleotide biosynthesis protein A